MAPILRRGISSAADNSLLPGIGSAFFGTLAGATGSSIDSALDLGARVQGPPLDNLGVQDSRYGAGIPITYGNVLNGTSVIRTFSSLTSLTVTDTAAEQGADWGRSIPSSFTVSVYQLNDTYGRGQAGNAVV
jgi:hypothetical protein